MQRFHDLIPSLAVVREQYAANLREAVMLRRLMRLSHAAERLEEEHRQIFGPSDQPKPTRTRQERIRR